MADPGFFSRGDQSSKGRYYLLIDKIFAENCKKHESNPVGCVLSAAVTVGWCASEGRGACFQGVGVGCVLLRGVCPGGCLPRGCVLGCVCFRVCVCASSRGFVLPRGVLTGGCASMGDVPPGMCVFLGGMSFWGGLCAPKGCLLQGVSARPPTPVDRMTDRCKKTLPFRNYVADGKNERKDARP